MLKLLENQLHSESQLPILACVKTRILEAAGFNAGSGVFREGIGHSKVPPIQEVLRLDAELKLGPLGDPCGLEEGNVYRVGRQTQESVTTNVSERSLEEVERLQSA